MRMKVYMCSDRSSALERLFEQAAERGLTVLKYRTFYKMFEGWGAEAVVK